MPSFQQIIPDPECWLVVDHDPKLKWKLPILPPCPKTPQNPPSETVGRFIRKPGKFQRHKAKQPAWDW